MRHIGQMPGLLLLLLATAPPRLAAQGRTMGLIYHDSTKSYQGYTLFAPMEYYLTYLIDNQGRLVHSWDVQMKPSLSAYLLDSGDLLHTAAPGGSGMNIRDWDDSLLWSFIYRGDSFYRHHDVAMLPNGNILSVARRIKSVAEVRAAGRDTAKIYPAGLWTDYLFEVNPTTRQVVWEWHAWDHMVQDFDSTKRNYGVVRDHPELIDLNYGVGGGMERYDFMHLNSVEYNPELDQIITSSRIYCEAWVIDHSTTLEQSRGHTGGRYGRGGDLLYRWGNPQVYRRASPQSHRFYYQHDPHWIADSLPGAGHMLVFNNGYSGRRWSSVEEWAPPVDSPGFYHLGPDSAYGPAEPVWWYRDTVNFYDWYISGCQRLPNGNTLICEGPSGTFFEVTTDSEVVWKYISPVDSNGPMHQGESVPAGANTVFRCYRYGLGYSAFVGRNMTPGDPIEFPPTGTAELGPAGVPAGARLAVSPNPFRTSTAISLQLAANGPAQVLVFDATGRLVRVLSAPRSLLPNPHSLSWDGRDQTGAVVPAGVYFAQAGDGTRQHLVKTR